MFGTVFILVDVLRTSFNTPVLLSLMQPLGTFERLRAHNIVKGIMDPFASFYFVQDSIIIQTKFFFGEIPGTYCLNEHHDISPVYQYDSYHPKNSQQQQQVTDRHEIDPIFNIECYK